MYQLLTASSDKVKPDRIHSLNKHLLSIYVMLGTWAEQKGKLFF